MANFSELDRYLFGQATHYEIYRKLGAHPTDEYGIRGVCFDLWAPNAARVWVIGSFNGWDEGANEMKRLEPETMGIFELFIPGVQVPHRDEGRKAPVQGGSLCELRGVKTRNGVGSYGY